MAQDLGAVIVNAAEQMNVVMNARRFVSIRVRSQLETSSSIFVVHGLEGGSSNGHNNLEAAINLVHEGGYRRLAEERILSSPAK